MDQLSRPYFPNQREEMHDSDDEDNDDGEHVLENLQRRVSDVMTSPVVASVPVTDIRRIAAAMLEGGLSAVPIVNESEIIVGIVSRTDVLRAVMTDPPLSLWR